MMRNLVIGFVRGATLAVAVVSHVGVAAAEERLPWQTEPAPRTYAERGADDTYRPGATYGNEQRYAVGANDRYDQGRDVYVPPAENDATGDVYRPGESYRGDPNPTEMYEPDTRRAPPSQQGYGEPYRDAPPPRAAPERTYRQPYDRNYGAGPRAAPQPAYRDGYEQSEIISAGHSFFGSISQGLGKAVEYVFSRQGRPNGYILGEDAGGAFVVGLRYGEGRLHTKDAGTHRVYWQGPSVGYDAGAEGSKAMVLVYNMRNVSDIYHRFGGVQGSFYVVGGVSVQFQKYGEVTLAVIRSGVGLRVGANVGYLKYTRTPTWNPL